MLDFINNLLPNFEKRRVLSQCEDLNQQLNDIILPILETSVEVIDQTGVTATGSEFGRRLEKILSRSLKSQLKSHELRNYCTIMFATSQRFFAKLTLLKHWANKVFEQRVASSGMNFKQMQVLRLIELGNFYIRYTIKALDYIVYQECEAGAVKHRDKPLTPAEIKWLEANIEVYQRLSFVYTMNDVSFNKTIEKTSELIVKEVDESQVIASGVNANPFSLNYVPVISDISFSVLEWYTDYKHKGYESNKSRLKAIQLRLQLLKQQADTGNTDPAIERQIEYYTSLVKQLEAKIHDYEKAAGVAE